MSFDYCIAYEDRAACHTSRWLLDGVRTLAAGNTAGRWLWVTAAESDNVLTVNLYKDAGLDAADKVAQGTADLATLDEAPKMCELSEANSSGLSGQLYVEQFTADVESMPLLVTLCTDADLAEEYCNLADLPASVYDATAGMARFCAVATRKVLLLVSQMFADQLGGFGAPEHRYHALASRSEPDFRRIAAPDQLTEAAVHWALMLAFGSCHERAADTMYSRLRDYHDAKRREAIAAWNLAFNTDPDTDDDADRAKSPGMIRVRRL